MTMTIDEILKARQELDAAKEEVSDRISDAYDAIGQLETALNRVYNLDKDLSKEEFAKWVAIGVCVGAVIDVEGSQAPNPLTVTGITSAGFIAKDAEGKEWDLSRKYLRLVEKFHVRKAEKD